MGYKGKRMSNGRAAVESRLGNKEYQSGEVRSSGGAVKGGKNGRKKLHHCVTGGWKQFRRIFLRFESLVASR